MTGEVEVFLDDTPGETRGMIARDGRFEHLLIQREGEVPQHRLGARCIGRIDQIDIGIKGAFVALGRGDARGFLSLGRDHGLGAGHKIEVEVTAEPREGKAAALKLVGPGEGEPRLVEAGPEVATLLGRRAPGLVPVMGLEALRASQEAQEEALSSGGRFASGLDLAVQRTRALVAVDIDHAAPPGVDAKKSRKQANSLGLRQAARLIRLKQWGGLVAVDLIGTGHDAAAVTAAARTAFGDDPEIVFGPINRFGVMMLSLPWRSTPIEEVLNGPDGRPTARTRAQAIVRALKTAMLSDTATPRFIARCAPDEAILAEPLVARLGPRAHMTADPGVAPGQGRIEEG